VRGVEQKRYLEKLLRQPAHRHYRDAPDLQAIFDSSHGSGRPLEVFVTLGRVEIAVTLDGGSANASGNCRPGLAASTRCSLVGWHTVIVDGVLTRF
jgi:hypothetical protein